MQALLVTFLWSSSWVLIKIGLGEIPALPFAGLRYSLAFLCLLPLALRSPERGRISQLPAGEWLRLILLGFLFYACTQGAQFLSLVYLPAATANLALSFTSILVALLGIVFLGEAPSTGQWGGTALFLFGVRTLNASTRPAICIERKDVGSTAWYPDTLVIALSQCRHW